MTHPLRTLVASLASALVVAASAPGCLPTDYLGFDPSLARDDGLPPNGNGNGNDPDGGGEVDGGSTCHGPDRSVPSQRPAAKQGVCGANVIDELASCLADAEAEGVDFFMPLRGCLAIVKDLLDPTCRACLVTPADSSSWGALVDYPGGILRPNFGGCFERTFAGAARCSADIDAVEQCIYVKECSCTRAASCPVSAQSECLDEINRRNACLASLPDDPHRFGAYEACRPKSDVGYWQNQLSLFCGT